jgi:hypothetical protein
LRRIKLLVFAHTPPPQRLTILLDEARQRVCEFVLRGAQPKKWLGPVLAAKGGGEVAMEELHLVVDQIDVRSP